jgi:TRAP-type C4-dicarboxylate transport system permease large subunit
VGGIRVIDALKDVGIILAPMLVLLLAIIFFPDLILFLPRLIVPQFLS